MTCECSIRRTRAQEGPNPILKWIRRDGVPGGAELTPPTPVETALRVPVAPGASLRAGFVVEEGVHGDYPE